MTIENGRPFTPGLPADRWPASAGRVRQPASKITFILRLAAILAMTIITVLASNFSMAGAEVNAPTNQSLRAPLAGVQAGLNGRV